MSGLWVWVTCHGPPHSRGDGPAVAGDGSHWSPHVTVDPEACVMWNCGLPSAHGWGTEGHIGSTQGWIHLD